ncbi:MAG: hypothetical protein HY703_09450 [Gemmatimonadetes bacterium]|nr:hypothetical protein [Gemmatimonadota bacterium]
MAGTLPARTGSIGDHQTRGLESAAALPPVSVPYDLAAGAANLERGVMGRVYTSYFLRNLRRKLRAKLELLAGRCDVGRALGARTLREFDDVATAPLHGFRDAADYYSRSLGSGWQDEALRACAPHDARGS